MYYFFFNVVNYTPSVTSRMALFVRATYIWLTVKKLSAARVAEQWDNENEQKDFFCDVQQKRKTHKNYTKTKKVFPTIRFFNSLSLYFRKE